MDDLFLNLLICLSALGFGIALRLTIDSFIKHRARDKYAFLEKAKDLCKGPHDWYEMKLAMREIPVGMYSICCSCGFVGNTDYRLNPAAMDVFRNNREKSKKDLDLKKRVYKRFQEIIEADRDMWIKSHGPRFTKDTTEPLLKDFSSFTQESLTKALERAQSEIKE